MPNDTVTRAVRRHKPLHAILFFLLLVLLPVQLGLHLWPDFALVLGRRIDYLSPTLFATDVLVILVIGLWLVAKWQKKGIQTGRRLPTKKAWSVVVLATLLVLNVVLAYSLAAAAIKAVKLVELLFLGLYILDTKPRLGTVVPLLSVAVIFSSILAYIQFLQQRSVGGLLWFLGERTFHASTAGIAQVSLDGSLLLRAYATFPHPNVLAGFVVVVLPLLALVSATKKWQPLVYAGVFAGVLVLPITFSRSAWLVFVAVVASVVLVQVKARFVRTKAPHVLAAATAFVLLALLPVFVSRLQQLWTGDADAVLQRQILADAAIQMASINPVFGVGLNNFLSELPNVVALDRIDFLIQPVHSIYLLILAETGIIGLLLFAALVVATLSRVIGARRWELVLSLTALLALGLFDHYAFTLQQSQLLATLVLALALAARPARLS